MGTRGTEVSYHPDMIKPPACPPGMVLIGPRTGGGGFVMWYLLREGGSIGRHVGEVTYYPDDEPNPWMSYAWPSHTRSEKFETADAAVTWLLRGMSGGEGVSWEESFPEFVGPVCEKCGGNGIDITRIIHMPPASRKWHPNCPECYGTGRISPWVKKRKADGVRHRFAERQLDRKRKKAKKETSRG